MSRYFEDVEVGSTIETGAYTFIEAEIIDFARQFDPQPFHTDPAAARASLFGGLVASGWHTAAAVMRLLVDRRSDRMAGRGSPGFDELRWLKPVRPGDTIRARFTLIEKQESRSRSDIGSCRFRCEVFNQAGETVMTAINIGIFDRRPQK